MLKYTGTWEQLEQMGFDKGAVGSFMKVDTQEDKSIHIMPDSAIEFDNICETHDLDTLFDLIQAGLVEKVVQE